MNADLVSAKRTDADKPVQMFGGAAVSMEELWWFTQDDGSLFLVNAQDGGETAVDSGIKALPPINRKLTKNELETLGDLTLANADDVAALAELMLAEIDKKSTH